MSETVLVVDDDWVTRLLSRRVLERGGYEVIEGADGTVGVEMAAAEHPALAILDWEMPHLSGVEACRLLRSQPQHEAMAIVIMSGHDEDEHRRAALAAGADAYLVKPVEPRDLLKRVNELVGAQAA